ncbi:unnamed protein product [Eruca vesicaria subsp. sativa]|uniref:Uncharacterized protein n=1 Tax=Eruca vesicaria subsp. sativa TaxID=29727 RepID=A0ABC8JM85_ERUVS|nr:unnamed protein product [Eruca vesicaria subsp. sativa]
MLKDQFFEIDQKLAKLEKIVCSLSKKNPVVKRTWFAKGVSLLLLVVLVIVTCWKNIRGFQEQCLNRRWASQVQ